MFRRIKEFFVLSVGKIKGKVHDLFFSYEKEMDKSGKTEDDKIADYIALALLIPKDQFWTELQEDGYYSMSTKKKVKWINKAAKRYKVDKVLVLKRIKQVEILMYENKATEKK